MSKRKYRHTASFGKREEFIAIGELLRRGFDVYLTLVDDQQIDCVMRKEVRGKPIYIDIQIKARSKDCVKKNAGTFAAMEVRKPRKNFFYIFYSEHLGSYWILPSLELIKHATRNKTGKNKGKYRLQLTNYSQVRDEVRPRPKFEPFHNENGFAILGNFLG